MCSDKYDSGPPVQYGYVPLQVFLEKLIEIRFNGIEKATDLAREGMEKRLDGMDEFCDALKDQAARFITRVELLAAVIGISTVISIIVSIIMKVLK